MTFSHTQSLTPLSDMSPYLPHPLERLARHGVGFGLTLIPLVTGPLPSLKKVGWSVQASAYKPNTLSSLIRCGTFIHDTKQKDPPAMDKKVYQFLLSNKHRTSVSQIKISPPKHIFHGHLPFSSYSSQKASFSRSLRPPYRIHRKIKIC